MATPVFACGAECGIAGPHWTLSGTASFQTSTIRSGARAGRVNPTAGFAGASSVPSYGGEFVGRVYLRFATLPGVDTAVVYGGGAANQPGVYFKLSDSSLYAGTTGGIGASGVAITTGVWYRIDLRADVNQNPHLIDVQVNGSACGQKSDAVAATNFGTIVVGNATSATMDMFWDDALASSTIADYPLGAGYILSYIPNADGSHNVAGANDFERTLTGTDITNATTTAYQLIDDRPLESAAGDFINGIAPPNSTDYVEWAYEDSVESVAPRSVEAVIGYHDASGAGTNNFTVTLRDSAGGTTADIMPAATRNVGATMSWGRAHFTTIPGGTAWTLTAFNALRSRFLVSDASPDPYIDGAMLEAEYAPNLGNLTNIQGDPFGQLGQRMMTQILAT